MVMPRRLQMVDGRRRGISKRKNGAAVQISGFKRHKKASNE